MASLFDIVKTFRPRRTILSEDFNTLQATLKSSFDLIGTAPPSGKTGVSTPFHCADPTEAQHAVTKGYFDGVAAPAFVAPIARAQEWAEKAEDSEITDNPGSYSARHWAAKAAGVVAAGAATPAQGAKADEAHGWGDHADAGYLVAEEDGTLGAAEADSLTLGSWTISESGGSLVFNNGSARFSISAAGKLTADDDVEAFGDP